MKDLFTSLMYRLGYISTEEASLRTVRPEKQERAREISRKLSKFDVTDSKEIFQLTNELGTIFKEAAGSKKHMKRTKDAISLVSMSDLYGYKPAMSRIYNLFSQNVFAAYAFVARHHPAIRACIQVILDEITNDGFVLISQKGTTRKRLKEVYRTN